MDFLFGVELLNLKGPQEGPGSTAPAQLSCWFSAWTWLLKGGYGNRRIGTCRMNMGVLHFLIYACLHSPFVGTASFYNFWDSSRYVKFGRHWAHIWNSLEFLGKGHLVSVSAGVPQPFKWIITPGGGCFGLSCKHIGKDDTSEIHMPFQFGVKWDSRSLGHPDKLTHTL